MGEHAAGDRIDGSRLWTDLMRLGEITEPDLPYTRRSFSTKFLEGREWLAGRFRDAGHQEAELPLVRLLGRELADDAALVHD